MSKGKRSGKPFPVSARSKDVGLRRSPAEIVGSNTTGGMSVLSVVLTGSLCDGLINRSAESHRLWCVVACDLRNLKLLGPWPTGGGRAKNRSVIDGGLLDSQTP
jgi:hypothetical protein